MLPAAILQGHKSWSAAREILRGDSSAIRAWLPHAPSVEVVVQHALDLVYDARTGRAIWLDEGQEWSPLEKMFQLDKCFVNWADAEMPDAELRWKVCRPDQVLLRLAKTHPRWMLRPTDVEWLPAGCKSFDKLREAVLEVLEKQIDQRLSAVEVAKAITNLTNPLKSEGTLTAMRHPTAAVEQWMRAGIREWMLDHHSIFRIAEAPENPRIEGAMADFLFHLARAYLRSRPKADLMSLFKESLRFSPPHLEPGCILARAVERDSRVLQISAQRNMPPSMASIDVHLQMVMMSFTSVCVVSQTVLQQWTSRLTPTTLDSTHDTSFAFLNLLLFCMHHVHNVVDDMCTMDLPDMISSAGHLTSLLEDNAVLARFERIPLQASEDPRLRKLARRHRREIQATLRRLGAVAMWFCHDLCELATLIDRVRLDTLKRSSTKSRAKRMQDFTAEVRRLLAPAPFERFETDRLERLQLATSLWNVRANRLRNAAVRDLRVWELDTSQNADALVYRSHMVRRLRERCHSRAYFRKTIDASDRAVLKIQFWWRMHRAHRGSLRMRPHFFGLPADHILMLRNALAVINATIRDQHDCRALIHGTDEFGVLTTLLRSLPTHPIAASLRSWIPTIFDASLGVTDEFVCCDAPDFATTRTSEERLAYIAACAKQVQFKFASN